MDLGVYHTYVRAGAVPSQPRPAADPARVPVIVPINGVAPQLPAFLAPNATLVGDVRFGPGCSVWFGAVLRADINGVHLGARCNV